MDAGNTFKYRGQELDNFALAENWKKYIVSILSPYLRGSCLEVGAGIGGFSKWLSLQPVASLTLLEPDPGLAGNLVLNAKENKELSRCKVLNCALKDIPGGQLYDNILYLDVLEHIYEDQKEVNEAISHLAPSGNLVILAPAFNFLFSEFDKAVGHFRRYTIKSLSNLAPPSASIEFARYVDSLGCTLSLANKIFLKSTQPTLSQVLFWDRFVIPGSRIVDPVVNKFFGKSVLMVFRKHG